MNNPIVFMRIGGYMVNVAHIVSVGERRIFLGNKVECDGSDVYLVNGNSVYYPGSVDEFIAEVNELLGRGDPR